MVLKKSVKKTSVRVKPGKGRTSKRVTFSNFTKGGNDNYYEPAKYPFKSASFLKKSPT